MTKKKPKFLNCARCLRCGDILLSEFRHDFQSCTCGAIYIDGGDDYVRRGGEFSQFDPKFRMARSSKRAHRVLTKLNKRKENKQ